MAYDIAIRGGTLVDGTGTPGRRADVGIEGGRIAKIGAIPAGSARREIDAGGRTVAPGFVDIHTHYDAQIFWDRMLTISPWHGVTTVVLGNCGFGVAPTRPAHRDLILRTLEKVEGMSFQALQTGLGSQWPFETFSQYLDVIERRGQAINVAVLVGHTPVRLYVMGEEATEREATAEEIAQMRAIVSDALKAGALGFSTSKAPTHVGYKGKPVPSRLASFDEISRLAGALSDVPGGMMQATLGPGLLFSEFSKIAKQTGKAVSWTALLAGMMGKGSHRGMLKTAEEIQAQGLRVYPQVTCRPLMFEFQMKEPFVFESMPLFKPVSAADLEGKKKIYRDAEFRKNFKGMAGSGIFGARWGKTVISWCLSEPSVQERTVEEVAAQRGIAPTELVLDLSLADDLETRFRMAVLNDDEDEVQELLSHPATVLGLSDAGAHASQLCDSCFATHLLGHWVREKGAIPLERAVWMLTRRTAEVFGISDRGLLAEGRPADAVVFDPTTVGASPLRRVNDQPAGTDRLVSEARGMDAVIVNGVLLRHQGKDQVAPDGALPGKLLRGGYARA